MKPRDYLKSVRFRRAKYTDYSKNDLMDFQTMYEDMINDVLTKKYALNENLDANDNLIYYIIERTKNND